MTVHSLGKRLLARIGVFSYDPAQNANELNRRGLIEGDKEEVLSAINAAMQICFSLGPVQLREQRRAFVLRVPTPVTLSVTQYSTSFASLATWADWMLGCTIRIAGDTRDNELVGNDELLRPFMGTTGTGIAATVYADAVPLDAGVLRVLEPVELPRQRPLMACATRGDFEHCEHGEMKGVGVPGRWFCEARYSEGTPFTQRLLRVAPMPDTAYSLSYRAEIKPPQYLQEDLYTETNYSTDPGTEIPFDWVESTLLPVALECFLIHPAFDNAQVADAVRRQSEIAKRVFAESSRPAAVRMRGDYR